MSEHHFAVIMAGGGGTRLWPVFAILGLAALGLTLVIDHYVVRAILGITGFTLLWSIKELFEQTERVKKGWFPENPARRKKL